MINLRTKNFDAIQDIHSELKNLIQRTKRQIKDNLSISRFISGLRRVSKNISRLVSHGVSDDAYLQYLEQAANYINILSNLLPATEKWLQEIALKIYGKMCAILPQDFQLSLFEVGDEFGWHSGEAQSQANILDWVKELLQSAELVKKLSSWLATTWGKQKEWRSVWEGEQMCLTVAGRMIGDIV